MIKLKNLLLEVHIDNKFQSELIDRINDEYREAYDSLTPQEINDGYCDMWASLFVERFGGGHQWSFDFPNDPNGHSWVKLDNKFYDAEMPVGTTKLINLPHFQRAIKKYGTDWLDTKFFNNIQKTKYETSNINKIEEIGPQNFIDMYLDWLEELLNDLEDSNDIEGIKRYDTVLNARFALEDADSTEIIQYLQQKYGNNVDQIILKIIGDTTKYDASGIDTPGNPNM